MAVRDFEGRVAIVTGASQGLGRACAELLGSRGASVVINDQFGDAKSLAAVAEAIEKNGGKAIVNTDSILNGGKIVETAVQSFGGLHILINAAGSAAQSKSFEHLDDAEWSAETELHIKGNYLTTNAAWKHFRNQSFGRIINVSSLVGLHGSPGQVATAAAAHSQVGYSYTLAKEGLKKNILVNVVMPISTTGSAAPNFDQSASIVAFLVHEKNKKKSGTCFQISDNQVARLRWQRSGGLLLHADDTLTPAVLLKNWKQVTNFDKPDYASGPRDFLDLQKKGAQLPPNESTDPISFKGRVVLITGAGSGLGRAYALHFASLGASVMVNDIADPSAVLEEIRDLGGKAASVIGSAEDGKKNVDATIRAFGRIDVVVNNAGILRDKAFHNMSEALWDPVLSVHLGGTYKNIRAAWPHFVKQGYGRVVNTTSVTGIYGQFGQANYAAAKSAIIGLTRALALEGAKHNILVNVIAPNAGTNMTKSILSDEVSKLFQPAHVAPIVSALASHVTAPSISGGVFEAGSGWFGNTRWEVLKGQSKEVKSLDEAASLISSLTDSPKSYPTTIEANIGLFNQQDGAPKLNSGDVVLANIRKAQSTASKASKFAYTQRDLVLYALSVGAKHTELPLVFEGHKDFTPLPVFGLIPFFNAEAHYKMDDIMSKYDLRLLLHVDQFLEIRSPIPLSGVLSTYPKLVQVVDKGKDVLVVQGFTTVDENGNEIFYNETTVLVRKGGGFGGDAQLRDRGPATAKNAPPPRAPDYVVEEKTSEGQAALYRLNGDLNPLHIDPDFSAKGGFPTPILHGLCSLGVAGKHLFQKYGSFKNLKGKFTSPVLPGQTLKTEMWLENGKVIFQVVVLETGKNAISGGAVTLDRAIVARL
ncbi:hypothetical protein BN1723_014438 [Verticillium longisporum]|uniref:Ketoreductase domain-containing protein n=1 Tax=Verticillium longisporum TaxID=100787 RepID=A0A0G4M9W3_VERLO|nr:Peroxisomal hydratase-dehydrogenase-epimerase like protein [Verticillium longisporum]CRK19572.1 hypothetical protein BN1708_012678 [Verticillium longisporum]CRK31078.1 hypothetical protein BN1723_014438 [Verticillium longisporum]